MSKKENILSYREKIDKCEKKLSLLNKEEIEIKKDLKICPTCGEEFFKCSE